MTLLQQSAPLTLAVVAWLVATPFACQAMQRVRSGFVADAVAQHGWLAGVVALAWIWSLQITSPLGISFGLLGSALFAVIFGYARALLGVMAAIALHTLATGGPWLNFGLNALLLGVFPVALAVLMQQAVNRNLPRNIFVFIFGNGLAVPLVVTALSGLLLLGATALVFGTQLPSAGDHFAYTLLLAWAEALVSGMIFSSLVIFLPRTVLTYDQDVYLPPRRA